MGPAMTVSGFSHTVWTRSRITVFPLFLVFLTLSAAHADHSTPLFSNDSLIKATIEAPFRDIMGKRDEEFEPPGKFIYLDNDGLEYEFDIKVRSRGRFRARKDVCDFTPLRLNFKKKQVVDTEFDGQDKLKLVTHCQSAGRSHEQLILREYLAYRFFAMLTDNAFRVRLLEITYVDSKGKSKKRTRFAFLIEHKDQVAERNHIGFAKVRSLEYSQVEPQQTNLLTVFSYFIGNTDFSAIRAAEDEHCCHNIMLLTGETGQFLPIPFDFDFSGIVDSPYAAPGEQFDVSNVTTRVYRGLCRNNELLPSTFAMFEEQHAAMLSLVGSLDALRNKTRKQVRRYVESFYDTIANQAMVEKEFLKECSEATGPPSQISAIRR